MATVADVNLTGWTTQSSSPIKDGNYPSSTRPSGGGSFAIPFGANRTSGVAPLAVQFDAGFDASDATDQDFHNLYYLWDYGDTGAGTWGTNGKSRNADAGPIGAHVFESAGTYTVGLTVIDPSTGSTVRTESTTITVSDPDTYYSGSNTVVVNNVGDADFTGAPSGSAQVNSDSVATVMSTYLANDTRILFKRGGSWSYSTGVVGGSSLSNATIGAYGTGTSPDEQGHYSNAPTFTSTADVVFFTTSQKQNCRVSDLNFASALAVGRPFEGYQNTNNLLVMNNKVANHNDALLMSWWRESDSDTYDGNFVVNNDFGSTDEYVFYAGGERLCILGNKVIDADNFHAMRVWQIYKGRISHNQIAGASNTTTLGQHALKLHAPTQAQLGDYATTGGNGLTENTHYVCVSDNEFGSSPPWPVSIEPQNTTSDERIQDLVFERNSYQSDFGTFPASMTAQIIFRFSGSYISIRNNLANIMASDAGTDGTGVNIDNRGIEPSPVGIYAHNNTITTNESGAGTWTGVAVASGVTTSIVRNNLLYAPNCIEDVLSDSGTSTTTATNLDNLTTPLVDPFNVTPASRDYSLAVSSGASNVGTDVAIYDDYSGSQRTGTFDVGAYAD